MEADDPFAIFQQPIKRTRPETTDEQGPRKMIHQDLIDRSEDLIPPLQDQQSDEEISTKRLEEVEIERIRTEEGCIYQVYFPKNYQRKIFQGEPTAKIYPFSLDPFQKKAVIAIESDENVLVCAHTSAGKTAIAEYAIAYSLQNNSRVIYTSPIKALSNQKYRQLKDQFTDVGLVTGDVAIDQNATCLVMTTQILRNMIYKGSQIVRQVKWVIFDEVHYMRDKERGVVWQETIIMLPPNVKYVFLSATIGNPDQFARWITKLRKQPCNVVYTDYRPVPLQHYLCPAGGDGLFLVVDDKGRFRNQNFDKAIQSIGDTVIPIGLDRKKKKMNQGSDLSKIIKAIMERGLDPVIVFSFSKNGVESYAKSICSKYDLTTKLEKERIEMVYNRALEVLDQKDRMLSPIVAMRQIVKKGVGIHHGGLLPLVKQVVQLLFQDGLLKVLFSTETFSMGLNMPARTVVFTQIKKFDGQKQRWITGGQYIQMSGRAGRRGLDKKGTTILMIDQKMQPEVAKNMLKGNSDNLLSSFYINYHMLLNSQRMQDIDVEYILARSFLQFQQDVALPGLKNQMIQKQAQLRQMKFQSEEQLQKLYQMKKLHKKLRADLHSILYTPAKILHFLNIGRIIHLVDGQVDWGYAMSINFHKRDSYKKIKNDGSDVYVIDAMVYIKPKAENPIFKPAKYTEEGEMVILPFTLNCLHQITALKLNNLPSDLCSETTKQMILKTMKNVVTKKITGLPIECNDPQAIKLKSQIDEIEAEIQKNSKFEPQLQRYEQKKKLYEQIRQLSKNIKVKSALVLTTQMKAHNRVIKRTGLVDKGVVTLKGRVTCEINSNHQILLTDLIFSGFFNDMNPIQIASLVSSLVHQEKSFTQRSKTKIPRLKQKLGDLVQRAKSIFLILQECKMPITEEEYVDSIKQQLVEITFDWCNGADFATILKKTDTYEGSIIRTWRRLHQLLNDMSTASRQIGNDELSTKFIEAGEKVYRGIVVSASLYVL